MSGKWIDVSMVLKPGMTVWPGDPPFMLEPAARLEPDGCNTSQISMCTHTGTHLDAAYHYLEDGKQTHEFDMSLFFGEALVYHYVGDRAIGEHELPESALAPRLLIRTRNSDTTEDGLFREDYVALDVSAAKKLVRKGVRLIGIDSLSIATLDDHDGCTHRVLLEAGIVIVEGLRLGAIPPGMHEFIVLPLALAGTDGAPCRAFVRLCTHGGGPRS